MINLKYFVVTTNTDLCEGRGTTIPTRIAFEDESEALKFVQSRHYKKFAVWGQPIPEDCAKFHISKIEVNVFENMVEYEEQHRFIEKEEKRRAALDKLTPEDRLILGLE
jgi:hypothetical protein